MKQRTCLEPHPSFAQSMRAMGTKPKKRKRGWRALLTKDVIALSISIVAIIISAVTAYFTLFRQVDNVSVVVDKYPFLELYDKTKVAISGESTLVFLNTGSRPASVIDLSVLVNQNIEDDTKGACEQATDEFKTNFEPLILEPNKVVLKKLKLKPSPFSEHQVVRQDAILFPVRGKVDTDEYFTLTEVELCFSFRLITPATSDERVYVHLGTMTASKPPHMTILNFNDFSKPQSLVNHTATIFDEWPGTIARWWRRMRNEPQSPDEEIEFKKPWWQ